ncbi:MAG: hypothetical protein OEY99_03935, partial [Aigarchaeota archaeon]|nr:hypothetical protein [Aigarchaeota archaeon]
MSDEDLELKMLQLKRLRRLAKAMEKDEEIKEEKKPGPLETVRSRLGDRGEEVLRPALDQYPRETLEVLKVLAAAIRMGKIQGKIDGSSLYLLFRSIGLRVKLDTEIKYY